ncbi:hypothetical protein BVX98_04210 [bacterium F11]|nr:hypothetical protein BVX98_04210 [bacterium F11]
MDEIEDGLVVEHERIQPVTYCVEWCPAMLRDAAVNLIDISLSLLEKDCLLQDAYPWNTIFRDGRPVFVDFTSIARIPTNLIWPAYDQFLSFFQRPLQLGQMGKGKLARSLLFDNIAGVSRQEQYLHLSFGYKMTHPLTVLDHHLDDFVQKHGNLKKKIKKKAASIKTNITREMREHFFKRLKARLETYKFPIESDLWVAYYDGIPKDVKKEHKIHLIEKMIQQLAPKTVTDLGCNTGVFSIIAAECGSDVISIDASESCIHALYQEGRKEKLKIVPIVSNVLCPTPPFGFLGKQYSSLVERSTSDLVLCLGLMHHLHIAGRQSFDRLASMLNQWSKKWLIFEFVAMDDDNNDLISVGRDIGYTLESVIDALHRYFPKIEVFDSDRPTRRLLLCAK